MTWKKRFKKGFKQLLRVCDTNPHTTLTTVLN